MRMRRLGWAGIELEAIGEHVVVDHMLDPGILSAFFGEERDELLAPAPGGTRAALVTHLHRDHADVAAIERALPSSGTVLRPPRPRAPSALDEAATGEAEAALSQSRLDVRSCSAGDQVELGPFSATAIFASDGLGSPQVSWLIEADGTTVLHCGDTMWHGAWWDVVLAHGPIDIACLPANGVEVSYPGWEPAASVPAVMTPDQAIEAARALQARTLIPIHYNRTFEHPDYYRPVHDARETLDTLAAQRGVTVGFPDLGEWVDVRPAVEAA